MKSALISVGTEILFGEIVNTNVVYLSQELNALGIDVLYHYTVGDNDSRLREILELALSDCDLVLTTGGLGPTEDDMTKETVASVMGDYLEEHKASRQALEDHAKELNHPMTENNYKQAMMPRRAIVFDNDAGTAPGFALEKDGKHVVCMPGPPREMKRMYQRKIRPFLEKFSEDVIYTRTVRLFGKGESSLETELLDLIDGQEDPTIATYAKEGECSVRVASKRPTREEAQQAADDMVVQILQRVGDHVFSTQNEELCDVVGKLLLDKGLHISCAESATAGMFASELAGVPGISDALHCGYVTYTEEAKRNVLGVKEETLKQCSVYSAEVAAEMAEGVFRLTGDDVCIAITGIAGPGSPVPSLVPGSAFIGLHYKGKTITRFHKGRNVNRNWNRHYMVLAMLDLVRRTVQNDD